MPKYQIEFVGEEGIDGIYEGIILWEKGYFVIHSVEGEKKKGYIPLTAIKRIIEIEEESGKSQEEFTLRRRLPTI